MRHALEGALRGFDKHLLRTSFHGGFTIMGALQNGHYVPEMEQAGCSAASRDAGRLTNRPVRDDGLQQSLALQ